MSARDRIFARIRAGQRRAGSPTPVELEAVRARLVARAPGPQPRLADDALALFRARALTLASTVEAVAGPREVPHAVGRYLRGASLALSAVCWPELLALGWSAAGLRVEGRGARASDAVGITGAFCAIAETGTLMMVSGPGTPATVSLLPETHIAIVRAARIVAHMEDAWHLLREESTMPRAVNFVSGPSRTADIEQTVTLGAHGPYRMHIIVMTTT
ncbi:MAG TPA: lactate utilization protein C [Burkholderiales bacterium]|nr:lactate utilization protein C [Burkholderiales bacterium]